MSTYLPFRNAADFIGLSQQRVEQLIRHRASGFPMPYQPAGPKGRRMFSVAELQAWVESRRAEYPKAA